MVEGVVARILARTRREGSCLIWLGCKVDGYGTMREGTKMVKVHRALNAALHGPIPAGVDVLHTCDNRACVEDGHHYRGTNAQNIQDKVRRDRSGKKLNLAKAKKVKAMLSSGMTQEAIARQVGVDQCTISRIKTGARWGHLQGGL